MRRSCTSSGPPAAGIALMSFTETIAAGRAFAREEDARTDSNQELVAVGAGNVLGGLFGAMPSGGGTSQTNVNLGAGARTQVAELVTAATAVATMLFLSPVLAPMPNAALAAVVIAYSAGLISPSEIAAIRSIRTLEFRWAVAAFAGVVLLGTLQGILAAVILSMVGLMQLANDPPLFVLGRKPGTNVFRPRDPDKPDDESFPGLLIIRTLGRMYFANAPVFAEKVRVLVDREKPKVLAIDCGAIPGLEFTALKMLVDADETLAREWRGALAHRAQSRGPRARAAHAARQAHGTRKDVLHRGGCRGCLPEASRRMNEREDREPVLNTIERVSEMCFGLFMALTFVGAVSAATAGQAETAARTMFYTALGCNLAWGLVDAVMYLVRTLTERGKRLTLALAVRGAPDARAASDALRSALPPVVGLYIGDQGLEKIREGLASHELPEKPKFHARDFKGATWIFVIVVLSTFPVALPFIVFDDMKVAMLVSRLLTFAMLFGGGYSLGRHAGYAGWKSGVQMLVLGVALTAAIIALGG